MRTTSPPPDGPTRRPAFAERWRAWRDRLAADPAFQRWASRFPPTRFVARRDARRLFDLCAGFAYSQILFACVELDLFAVLRKGPLDADALAEALGLAPDAVVRLLRSAAALGLVERRGPTGWGLGLLGAAALGAPGVAEMVRHHRLLYADLADPVALLRGGAPPTLLSAYWAYARDGAPTLGRDEVDGYSALMAASQSPLADDILDAWPASSATWLLDVGGGDGVFLARALARSPSLRGTLVDLPAVADRARARLSALGLEGRATVVAGDFRRDPLPAGPDVATLVRIALDHDDATVLALLRAVFAALAPGGAVALAEPLAETAGDERLGAYFGVYLLAMGRGRARSFAELAGLLRAAGFRRVRAAPTRRPLLASLIVGQKPDGL